MTRAALVALALLVPGPVLAQQRAQPAAPRPDALAQQVEQNIRTCIGTSQDMALVAPRLDNAVERLLATQADPGRRAGLAGVQAAWVQYRDARCDFAGTNPDRGADAAADRAACLLQFDLGRTLEIEQLLAPPPPPPAQQPQRRR